MREFLSKNNSSSRQSGGAWHRITYSREIFPVQNIVEQDLTAGDPAPNGGRLSGSADLQGLKLSPQPRHVVAPELRLLSGPVQRGEVGE